MWAWLIPLAAGVIGAIGSLARSNQAAAQYDAYAQANDYNAAVLRQRADTAHSLSTTKESAFRRSSDIALGKQRAAIAQSGTGEEGSNADVEAQSQVMRELDSLNIMYEGDLEAWGLDTQANIEDYQASVNRWSARTVRKQRWMGVAGSLLSGAGGAMAGYGGYSAGYNAGRGSTGNIYSGNSPSDY
jgi:hypothetical protein